MQYHVETLGQIAAHFESMAQQCETRADLTTGITKKEIKREAWTWRQAAQMLRHTTLTPRAEPVTADDVFARAAEANRKLGEQIGEDVAKRLAKCGLDAC